MSCVPPDFYQKRFLDYMKERFEIHPEDKEKQKSSLKTNNK